MVTAPPFITSNRTVKIVIPVKAFGIDRNYPYEYDNTFAGWIDGSYGTTSQSRVQYFYNSTAKMCGSMLRLSMLWHHFVANYLGINQFREINQILD